MRPINALTQSEEQDGYPEYFAITEKELDLNRITERVTLATTGAVAIFSGKVRGETTLGEGVQETAYLFYEAYPEMAEAKLRQVAAEIRERWPLVEGIAAVQRIGRLEVGETTILVACSSGHRGDGVFEAARYGIDRVKEIVPVWKKEVGPDGEEWVEGHYHPSPQDAPERKVSDETVVKAEDEDIEVEPVAEMHFVCPDCDESYALDTRLWQCECGQTFELANMPSFNGELVETDTFSMWRYRAMLLPDGLEPVSMGEGWTPILEAEVNGRRVHLKMESLKPQRLV